MAGLARGTRDAGGSGQRPGHPRGWLASKERPARRTMAGPGGELRLDWEQKGVKEEEKRRP